MKRRRGFTLIELVVTLALVSVLALVAVPLYEVTTMRIKESELRTALRQIRTALDAYKQAADAGTIAKSAGDSGYPATLTTLVVGVDTLNNPAQNAASPIPFSAAPAPGSAQAIASQGGPGPSHLVFLRQVPRDPLFEDQSVPPEQQWNIRAYGAAPDDFSGGSDVYDVSSKSTAVGSNGIAYKDW